MELNDRSDTRCEILTRVVFVNGATSRRLRQLLRTAIVQRDQFGKGGMFYE